MGEFLLVNVVKCIGCGRCLDDCSCRLFSFPYPGQPPVTAPDAEERCIRCGHCVSACPEDAVTLDGMTGSSTVPVDRSQIPTFGQFVELVKSRRSIRNYKKDTIAQEDLDKLFDLLHWSPTAKNLLQLKWGVINDWNKVHELAGIMIEGIRNDPAFEGAVRAWDNGYDGIHRGAPCIAFVYGDENSVWTMTDSGLATEILELGASALGLGACWAGLFMIFADKNPKVREFLGLKPGEKVGGALMLGYPAGTPFTKAPFRPKSNVRYI